MARLRVRVRSTGQTGSVDSSEFDSSVFELIEQPQPQQQTPSALASLGGGALNLLRGIFQAPQRLGQGISGLVNVQREQQRLQQESQTDALLRQLLGRQAARAETPEEQSRLERQIQQLRERGAGQEQQFQQQVEKTFEDLIKGGAGTTAFGVGGGTTPARRILGGVAAGGLAGLGASRPGEEEEAIVGGAITGGVLSGGAELAGKVARGLQARRSAGVKPPKLTGKKLKSDPFFVTNKAELQNVAQRAGVTDAMTPTQKLQALQGSFDDVQGQINQLLQGADDIPEDKLVNNFVEFLDQTEFSDVTPSQRRFLNNLLGKLSNTGGNPIAVNNLKSSLRSELSRAFNAIDKGNLPSAKDQAKMALFNSLKSSLDDLSPQIRELNTFQKGIFDVGSELADVAKKDQPIRFKLPVGGDVPLGVTPGQREALGTRIGTGLRSLLGLPARALASLTSQPAVRNIAISQVARGLAEDEQVSETTQTPVLNQLMTEGMPEEKNRLQQILTPETLTVGLLSGELSASDIGALQKLGVVSPTQGVAERRAEADKGRVTSGLQQLRQRAGNVDTPAKIIQYNDQKRIVAQFLARLVETGRLSDQDRQFYINTLPGPIMAQLAPELAKSRIDNVISIINETVSTLPLQDQGPSTIDQLLNLGQ